MPKSSQQGEKQRWLPHRLPSSCLLNYTSEYHPTDSDTARYQCGIAYCRLRLLSLPPSRDTLLRMLREAIALIEMFKVPKAAYIKFKATTPTIHGTVFEDNSACLEISNVHKMPPRSKRTNVQHYDFRSYVNSGEISISPIHARAASRHPYQARSARQTRQAPAHRSRLVGTKQKGSVRCLISSSRMIRISPFQLPCLVGLKRYLFIQHLRTKGFQRLKHPNY
jgi:hypothetical protein